MYTGATIARRFRRLRVLIAVLGLAVVAACAPATEPSTETGGTSTPTRPTVVPGSAATSSPTLSDPKVSVSGIPLDPAAKFGGTLRKANTSEGPSFSLWEEAGGIPFAVGQPVTNMLVQPRSWGTNEDFLNHAYLEIAPDLAQSWEQSADGLSWTFKLREGIKWSDGTPLTCADAKWSFDSIRTGDGLRRSPRAVHFFAVKDTICADDLTFVINLNRAKPGFLEVIGMPYNVVLPKHIYDGKTDLLRENPISVGTGPFVLTSWIPGEQYTFARKADYWNQPFPYLEGLEVPIIATSAQATAIRAGRIDIGPIQGFQAGAAEQVIRECTACQVYDRVIAMGVDPALMVNHTRAPWNEPAVKDAISLAIDRKKLVQVAFGGWADPVTAGVFFPGSYWAMPPELLKTIPGYNLDTPEENKERARQLLHDAGYAPGELEIPLSVGVYSVDEVPLLIEDLQAVGFKVTPHNYEVAATYEIMGAGDFDVFVHGFWTSGIDPDFQLYEQFYTGSDRNYNRYSNPAFDLLVDEMSQTLDVSERRQKAWDAAEIALREHAKFFLAMQSYTPIVGGRVRGFMPSIAFQASYGPLQRSEVIWIDE